MSAHCKIRVASIENLFDWNQSEWLNRTLGWIHIKKFQFWRGSTKGEIGLRGLEGRTHFNEVKAVQEPGGHQKIRKYATTKNLHYRISWMKFQNKLKQNCCHNQWFLLGVDLTLYDWEKPARIPVKFLKIFLPPS